MLAPRSDTPSGCQELLTTLKVAFPIILAQLGQIFMAVTDSFMVGPLGAAPLAASAFVSNVVNIPFVFLLGLCTCISVKVSQSHGAGNITDIARYFWHGLILCTVVSIAVTGALLLGTPLLDVFQQPADVMAQIGPYYILISLSLVPIIIFSAGRMFCDGFSDTLPSSVILILGLVLNIFLNWIFIYGKWGFPAMGLTGAGIATLITRVAVAVAVFIYIFRAKAYRSIMQDLWRIPLRRDTFAMMTKLGVPSGMQFLFEVGAFSGAGVMVGWISTAALAAHQIAINFASLTFMVALGLSIASTVRVGQATGRRDIAAVRRIGVSSLTFIFAIETLFAATFFILRGWLPTLYISDSEVIAIAAQLLIVAGLFQIFDGVQAVGAGILRGMADVKVPTAITFCAYWIVGLPLAYVLAFPVKLNQLGIWVALATALIFAAVFLVWRFLRLARKVPVTG